MTTRNFYVVLGVPSTETSAGIRRAFRELALRYHPDRAGAQGTHFFREIVEAYQVLSDPERRASYDEGLLHPGGELPARMQVRYTGYPEPEPLGTVRSSPFRAVEVMRPLAQEVFDHLWRPATDPWPPKPQRLDAFDFEVLLSAEEAARGGVLDLGVPVFRRCRACHGAGYRGPFACRACGGQGMEEEEEAVPLVIPRLVRDGTRLRLTLRRPGIHGMDLHVLIRVAA